MFPAGILLVILLERILSINVLEVLVIRVGMFIVGYKEFEYIVSIKLDVSLSELRFKLLMLKSSIRIVSFFSLANFSKRGTK